MSVPDIVVLLLLVHLPFYGFAISKCFTSKKKNQDWFNALKLPPCIPPFKKIWIILYAAMGYASYLVWKCHGGAKAWSLYGLQLAIQWSWPAVFYGLESPKLGFYWNIMLTFFVVACGIVFGTINQYAGFLFIPYVLWLIYASWFDYQVWKLNGKPESI